MVKQLENLGLWTRIIFIILFAIALTIFRILWIQAFNDPKQQEITEGELNLRDWDFSNSGSITLSGEWELHPYALLEKAPKEDSETMPQYIDVPSDWSYALNEDKDNPYGYGSYHLRIHVDEDKDTSFSMRIPSVRSASALYANGLLVGKSGEVGKDEADSFAHNVPYTSTSIRADEDGVIDIVLQVANHIDPRASGFVRSVKFGYEEDIKRDSELSTILQIVTAVIFIVHALFAILIYLVGIRDKRFIYFSIALLTLTFINLTGGDEKVLYQYLIFDYTFTFKWAMFMMVLLSWSLVHTVGAQIEMYSKRFLPVYSTIAAIAALLIVLLPMEHLASSSRFTFSVVFIGAAITTITLLRSRKSFKGGIWMALSVVAIGSHYFWWAYMMTTGVKVIYYPFDLIIAIICLAGVWFKHYNEMHVATKNQALRLKESDKEKDEFLANTSHELRNPLHSILNISQGVLEREGTSLQRESVRNLETVLSVSQRMSFVLNDLLEMTRLQGNKPQLHIESTSLQAITAGVIDMLQYKVGGKSLKIVNDVPKDFPAVLGDENRVTQIVFNLLHNAIKYTPDGEVIIRAINEDNVAHISITDTGIGMDKDMLRYLFEPYVQGKHDELMTEGGFGLGLNISEQLVKLHGGTLQVNSKLGKGSTFTFTLPIVDSETDFVKESTATLTMMPIQTIEKSSYENDSQSSSKHTQPNELHPDCPRIIVVDDDPVNLEVMKTILSVEQYDVQTVLSGKEALILLDKQMWDLIISDVMMPEMSGYELTRHIRKRFTISELPVLLLTARNRPEDIENGFSVGANDYVTKPIDGSEIRARVKALTEVKRLARERLRMESAWLQAQIQPHFIFNTLNSIMGLSEIDTSSMQRLIDEFSTVLRVKFNFQNLHDFVSMEDELSLVQSYVYIQQVRYQDRLQVKWDIEEDVDLMIPALTIQPLVENAIEHGVMPLLEGGEITVRVKDLDSHIEVKVEDNGVGIDSEKLQQILAENSTADSGIGLKNTNERLKRLFGKGLEINSRLGEGTTVKFIIPLDMD